MRNLTTAFVLMYTFLGAGNAQEPLKRLPNDPVGLWLGVLKVGPMELRLAFQIDKDADGKLGGKLVSLDQGRAVVPCKQVTFDDKKLSLELPAIAVTYTAKFDDAGIALAGEFKQAGQTFPLRLERIEKLPSSNRPQTPKAPFPYEVADASFENAEAKNKLAGTLTVPKGTGPFPAVVLVSGSGPQDRDETIFEHKPFWVIADSLARRGIACLRYDDRGVGKSGGKFAGATSADFATDAFAAVQYLKAHKAIDARRIGICGHSEGGIIAPLVATAHPDEIAFIILLAGPGISGDRILVRQMTDFSGAADAKAIQAEVERFAGTIVPILKLAKTTAEAKEQLSAAIDKSIADEKDEKKRNAAEKAKPALIAKLADPWMRWFVAHDPVPTLSKVKCPVLALNGEKDMQVRAKENLDAIDAALKQAGNTSATCLELKGLNHLFQNCKTGQVSEYTMIEETFAPSALAQIADWIAARK